MRRTIRQLPTSTSNLGFPMDSQPGFSCRVKYQMMGVNLEVTLT